MTELIAKRRGLSVYNHDRYDVRDLRRLEVLEPQRYGATFTTSVDIRWLEPTPEALAAGAQITFRDPLPFVLCDLLDRTPQFVMAEGFGLTANLVAPHLQDPQRGLWLIPIPQFKRTSMLRRQKPAFAAQSSDPERAFDNLYTRDMPFAAEIMKQARAHDFRIIEVDGSQSPEELAYLGATHFDFTKAGFTPLPSEGS